MRTTKLTIEERQAKREAYLKQYRIDHREKMKEYMKNYVPKKDHYAEARFKAKTLDLVKEKILQDFVESFRKRALTNLTPSEFKKEKIVSAYMMELLEFLKENK